MRALHAVAANVAVLAEDVEAKVERLADDVAVVSQDIQGRWREDLTQELLSYLKASSTDCASDT